VNMRPRRREDPDVNLTPLIDVVFLLLIFFMVSTTFTRETELKVQLPEAGAEAVKRPPRAVEVTVSADGRYFVDGRAVVDRRVETLRRAIEKAAGGRRDMPLVIRADARAHAMPAPRGTAAAPTFARAIGRRRDGKQGLDLAVPDQREPLIRDRDEQQRPVAGHRLRTSASAS